MTKRIKNRNSKIKTETHLNTINYNKFSNGQINNNQI